MTTGQILANQIERTREWTLLVVEGFQGSDWTFQPQPGLQHALWLCGHMACAQDLLLFQCCLGRSELDPAFMAHFAIGGPVPSATEHEWPAPETVLQWMHEMQSRTVETLRGLTDESLEEPAFGKDGARHPHYDNRREAMAHLVRHEAFHAGQLAMLRRLMGKPFLR